MIALYIARRLGEALITLLTVGLAVFLLLHLMPYNVAAILAGASLAAGDVIDVTAPDGPVVTAPAG